MFTGADEFCNNPDCAIPADIEFSNRSRLVNSSNVLFAKK